MKVVYWSAIALLALTGLAFGLFVGVFSGTDVKFQSSDGEWAAPELRFKGEDFMHVATEFEAYRAKCSPAAVLQRTTMPPSWHEWQYWFNDYSQCKWKVPYAQPVHAEERYPRLSPNAKGCAAEVIQDHERQAARERAVRLYGEGT